MAKLKLSVESGYMDKNTIQSVSMLRDKHGILKKTRAELASPGPRPSLS